MLAAMGNSSQPTPPLLKAVDAAELAAFAAVDAPEANALKKPIFYLDAMYFAKPDKVFDNP
jgi:hypothetical protein